MTKSDKTKRMINFRPALVVFLFVFAGIYLARYFSGGSVIAIVLASCVAFGGVLMLAIKKWKLCLLVLLSFGAGVGLYFAGVSLASGKQYSGEVAVVGRVAEVEEQDYSFTILLEDCYVDGQSSGNISLYISSASGYSYSVGQVLSFESELESVHLFTLGSFSSSYYRDSVKYTASVSAKSVVQTSGTVHLDEAVRQSVKELLYANMSQQNASVCYAVLFGDKSGIDSQLKDAYTSAGIVHILTVSGLHISFLILLVTFALKKLHLKQGWSVAILAITLAFYNYLCGFSPSIARASIMGLCMSLSLLFGRRYDPLSAASFSGIVTLLFYPLCAFDSGFLMSYGCVFAIFLLFAPLQRLLLRFFHYRVASYFALSICAQIGVLPCMASFYQEINLLAFFVNFLVVPIFSLLFPVLFVVSFVGALLPFVGVALKLVDFGFNIISLLASFYASTWCKVSLEPISLVVAFLFCVAAFVLSRFFMASSRVKAVALALLLFFSGAALYADKAGYVGTSVSYLNYYGEECLVLTSSSGQHFLVGSVPSENFLQRFQICTKIYGFDFCLLFEDEEDLVVYSSVRIDSYIMPSSFDGEEVLAGHTYQAGDFSFVYLVYRDCVVGAEISFDEIKIFFATESNLSYNNKKYLDTYLTNRGYSVLVQAGQTEGTGTFTISQSGGDGTMSYATDGNFIIKLGESAKVRCID